MIIAEKQYQDAFGNRRQSGADGRWDADASGWSHNTKERDEDIGIIYMYQRWYQPETGTFLSRAPYRPMIEHQYSFAVQSPVNNKDIRGMLSASEERAVFKSCFDDRVRDSMPTMDMECAKNAKSAYEALACLIPAARPFKGGCGNYADQMCGGDAGSGELLHCFMQKTGKIPNHTKILRRNYNLWWGPVHADCLLIFDDGVECKTDRTAITPTARWSCGEKGEFDEDWRAP